MGCSCTYFSLPAAYLDSTDNVAAEHPGFPFQIFQAVKYNTEQKYTRYLRYCQIEILSTGAYFQN